MTAPKAPLRTAEASTLLGPWIGFGTAFVCFVLAGQALTSRATEALESLDVALPFVTEVAVVHPKPEAAIAVTAGIAFALFTQGRVRGALGVTARLITSTAAVLTSLVAALLIYSSVLAFERLQVALQQ